MMNGKKSLLALLTGAPIGCLGGLIGLGGAEFRLPVLMGLFKYSARQAVPLNLAVSLITLLSSLVFRLPNAPLNQLVIHIPVILSLIVGGMIGAYKGAQYSKHLSEQALEKVILILLIGIGLLLITESFYPVVTGGIPMPVLLSFVVGVALGLGIGIVSSLLGVAGGELIIPTLILVYGLDIKIAGTASIIISLPTVLIGLLRHRSNGAFSDNQEVRTLVLPMGIGSIIGSFIGGALIVYVSSGVLKLVLGTILIISAVKMYLKSKRKHSI
ncbi:sulfite exporter TauE/SafE family protein [Cohnella sp.]|uniref:sulfite exporter TauE/SafE family protein n=1 Tax=Cohnella sp. TaxID=1883426 RepID=UPI0035685047